MNQREASAIGMLCAYLLGGTIYGPKPPRAWMPEPPTEWEARECLAYLAHCADKVYHAGWRAEDVRDVWPAEEPPPPPEPPEPWAPPPTGDLFAEEGS